MCAALLPHDSETYGLQFCKHTEYAPHLLLPALCVCSPTCVSLLESATCGTYTASQATVYHLHSKQRPMPVAAKAPKIRCPPTHVLPCTKMQGVLQHPATQCNATECNRASCTHRGAAHHGSMTGLLLQAGCDARAAGYCLVGSRQRAAVTLFPPAQPCLPCTPLQHLSCAAQVQHRYHLALPGMMPDLFTVCTYAKKLASQAPKEPLATGEKRSDIIRGGEKKQ